MLRSIVLRSLVRNSCLVALLAVCQFAVAQDFSADVINQKTRGGGIQKIYATKDKVRYEVAAENAAMGPIALIVDEAQNKWLVLMPQRHMYLDTWPTMMKRPTVAEYWHVEDVNDACPHWKKIAEQAGIDKNWGSCTKTGSDTLHGRSTVKYEGVSTQGNKDYYWVDTKLHCIIKMEGGGASEGVELTNIQEGSQPSSLFEVPAGYQKVDLGAMMGQMGGRPH